jgi:hypothetical protein
MWESGAGGSRPDLIIHTQMPETAIGGNKSVGYQGPDFVPDGMRNEAVTKALNKIADQKVDLGENLATLGQTTRLLGGSVKTLADFLQKVWRDKHIAPYLGQSARQLFKRAERGEIPRDIANRYLEYVYGWKPLVQDVYGLWELATKQSKPALLMHAKGSSTQQAQGPSEEHYLISFEYRIRYLANTQKSTCRCHVWAMISPDWAGLRSLNQLGLLNPLSLAWELTPWSFVVDWLLPIGPVLRALSAPAGLTFVDGSLSYKQINSAPFENWYSGYDNYREYSNTVRGTATYHAEGYLRGRYDNWPLPGLYVDPDPLRGDRIFKAAALAVSNLSGKRNF